MLKAVELLAARRRDDLRVVGYQCGSLPEYHVIFEAPSVDTEVDPPQQIFPANDDEPILTHCKKAQGRRVNTSIRARLDFKPALSNRTARTYDRINLSQRSRCSQRPRLVTEEVREKRLLV